MPVPAHRRQNIALLEAIMPRTLIRRLRDKGDYGAFNNSSERGWEQVEVVERSSVHTATRACRVKASTTHHVLQGGEYLVTSVQ